MNTNYFLRKLFLVFSFISSSISAQQQTIPLYFFTSQRVEQTTSNQFVHTGFKPLIESFSVPIENTYTQYTCKKKIAQRIFAQDLIVIKDSSSKFKVTINPLLQLDLVRDRANMDTNYFQNTRGILIRGNIGKQFSFETSFYENQARFVPYIDTFVRKYEVVPGQGRVKAYKVTGFDFAMASGHISYSPSKYVNLQLGNGKHFLGNGYRSMLLSDNVFNYPYFRATSNFKKLQYSYMIASLQAIDKGRIYTSTLNEPVFQKKIYTVHYLSYIPFKKLQLGLFQSVMWNTRRNFSPSLDVNYFNPIIFSALGQYGLSGNNNVMIGSNILLSLTKNIRCYSQFVLDDVGANLTSIKNKKAYQLGAKWNNVLTVKNLFFQVEYNQARPFTYAHKKEFQSFTHYNQSLAHPLGANFKEVALIGHYEYKRLVVSFRSTNANYGADSTGTHVGKELLNSDSNASTLNTTTFIQGINTVVTNNQFKIGCVLNPVTNLVLSVGLTYRTSTSIVEHSKLSCYFIQLSTNLSNFYFDF